jgi:hypothetical protein
LLGASGLKEPWTTNPEPFNRLELARSDCSNQRAPLGDIGLYPKPQHPLTLGQFQRRPSRFQFSRAAKFEPQLKLLAIELTLRVAWLFA